jgi:hypothetical protein
MRNTSVGPARRSWTLIEQTLHTEKLITDDISLFDSDRRRRPDVGFRRRKPSSRGVRRSDRAGELVLRLTWYKHSGDRLYFKRFDIRNKPGMADNYIDLRDPRADSHVCFEVEEFISDVQEEIRRQVFDSIREQRRIAHYQTRVAV